MKAKIFGAPASPTPARPRTGHQSIRGRISGPIPMPNPLDDDEFPMRNPGTGIASSLPLENGLTMPPRPLQQTASAAASPTTQSFPSAAPPLPTNSNTDVGDMPQIPQTVPELPTTPKQAPRVPGSNSASGPSPEGASSSGTRTSTARTRRTNPTNSARYSTISANSEKTGESNGQDGPDRAPQRKKSTLRSALGKLLRRRKKEGSLSSVSEVDRTSTVAPQYQHQHRSVPPAARSVPTEDIQVAKRVISLPISEFDRALRSHSVGPDDITAIESARNSIDILGAPPIRKRAVATQDRLITTGIPRSRGEEWAGLSPRPASSHARGLDPDAIGRAISSDSDDIAHKRRSRSLSQLNEVMMEQGSGRRRSDEIRYWRESYDVHLGQLSPLSSGPAENETDNNDEAENLGRASMSIAESSNDKIPKTPPQPFNFGSLASMNEMAGMKITQAASLDERFHYLEARLYKIERVVDQLCHSVPGFKSPFANTAGPSGGSQRTRSTAGAGGPAQNGHASQPAYAYRNAAPPTIPSIYKIDSPTASHEGRFKSSGYTNSHRSVETNTDDNVSSRISFGDAHPYNDSLHPPSSSATQAVSTVATSVPPVPGLLRPTSEATVRPAASMPSLGSSSTNTNGEERSSNSAALLAQLDSERAARQLLEDQVRKLSERMNNLSSTMFAMVRDPAKSRSSERLRPQTATTPPTNSTNQLAPLSLLNANSRIAPSSKAQSIFGRGDTTLNSIASSPAKEIAEDEFEDAFETPREAPEQGLGLHEFGRAYGGEAETEEERKMAARTLSLSQLTMGKGFSTRI